MLCFLVSRDYLKNRQFLTVNSQQQIIKIISNDVGMPLMRGVATPLCLRLIIEPGVRGGRREHEKVSNFWRRLKGRFAKSQLRFIISQRVWKKFEN